jgi:hypothetical protein
MGQPCSTHESGKIRTKFWQENLKERDHLEGLGTEQIILKWSLKSRIGEIGFIWPRIGTSSRLLWTWKWTFHKALWISWLLEQLLASQERFAPCSKLVYTTDDVSDDPVIVLSDIIHCSVFYLKQRFGDCILFPSSDKKPIQLGPNDRASPCLWTIVLNKNQDDG